jgi:hypothetical protein
MSHERNPKPETQKQISETQNQKTENPKTGNAVK